MYNEAHGLAPRLHDRVYREALYRAENENTPNAALELALCHCWGIGTPVDWKVGINWLEKAVSAGSEVALIYLKKLQPESRHVARTELNGHDSGSTSFEILAWRCKRAFVGSEFNREA